MTFQFQKSKNRSIVLNVSVDDVVSILSESINIIDPTKSSQLCGNIIATTPTITSSRNSEFDLSFLVLNELGLPLPKA
jgi:hypothetical protein